METPTRDAVRLALEPLDLRRQKIVAGLLGVMIHEPNRVRDGEWMSEQLVQLTVLAGGFEAVAPDAALAEVQAWLQENAVHLLGAATLLFQRVGLDLAPRAESGFSFEDAMRRGLEYMPRSGDAARARERDLGEQPLARKLAERGLKAADLVAASSEQLSHKMVARAARGRRLTANTMDKVQRAWNRATSSEDTRADLFDYEP